MSEALSNVVNTLKAIYLSQDNDARRYYTIQLEQLEQSLASDDLVKVGLSLLSNSTNPAPVQAYGAVILKKAIHFQGVRVEKVPFWDLMHWYCTDASLNNLLCADLEALLLMCAFRLPENAFGLLFDRLLATNDLAHEPRRVRLMSELIVRGFEPDLSCVPRDRVGGLRGALCRRGAVILPVVNQTLFSLYTAAGGEAFMGEALQPASAQGVLEGCIAIVAALAPQLTFAEWVRAALGETMAALLRWRPARRGAVDAATALLRSTVFATADAATVAAMTALLDNVRRALESAVTAREIDLVENVLNLLVELPKPFMQAAGPGVCQSLIQVLGIPSLLFASQVCSNLMGLDEAVLTNINPVDIYSPLRFLAVKNQFHPRKGTHAEGMALSQEQLGSEEAYERAFSDFRNQCGKILELLARLFPELTNKFIFQLLNELCDPAGTNQDERTQSGFVTQRSQTFLSWEVSAFMINHMSAAFSSTKHLSSCITALIQRHPKDAVLLPVYLNTLSYFWRCREPATLNIWEGTLNILFTCIEEKNNHMGDPDVSAARRRAHTLLIAASTEHAPLIPPELISKVIQRIRSCLVASRGMERLLLYEAVAGFAVCLPSHEGEECMTGLISPVLSLLKECAVKLNQEEFNRVILGETRDLREVRDSITDSLGILAAVFRRCCLGTCILELVTELVPILNHLTMVLHGIKPEALPPPFAHIFDLPASQREQYLPGNSRCSVVGKTPSALEKVSSGLMNIRFSLYQLYGSLCRFISSETLEHMLQFLGSSMDLPIHHLRTLSEKCLFLIGQRNVEMLPHVLCVLQNFFMHRTAKLAEQANMQHSGPAKSTRRHLEDDVIESKQWLYYAKDVLSFVRVHVLDNSVWKDSTSLLSRAVELAAAVLDSNSNSINACRLLISVVDMKCDLENPALATMLQDTQLVAYSRLIRYLVFTGSGTLAQREKETIAYLVAEPYTTHYPKFERSLEFAGVPPKQVEELKAGMILANGPGVMRRKVKEKFLAWAST